MQYGKGDLGMLFQGGSHTILLCRAGRWSWFLCVPFEGINICMWWGPWLSKLVFSLTWSLWSNAPLILFGLLLTNCAQLEKSCHYKLIPLHFVQSQSKAQQNVLKFRWNPSVLGVLSRRELCPDHFNTCSDTSFEIACFLFFLWKLLSCF